MALFDPRAYSAPSDLLTDRVILITGATAGIGRVAALTFARHGATVALHGRNQRKLETLYDEIASQELPTPIIAVMDLAKAHGPNYFQLAEEIDKQFGRLDGLLHNAGLLGQLAPIEHYSVSDWANVMHVNLTVPFVLTQVLLPLLKKSPDASVVFTSSGVGRIGRAFWGAYAVSKFGIEGLSQVLADEVGENDTLRVNCINPGSTRTAMRASAYPGEDPQTLRTPEEIMATYLYLLGPDSRDVNGQSLDAQ